MEPRPQRPRTVGGQPQPQLSRGGSGGAPIGHTAAAGAAPGGYPPEGADPTLIAPSRTEYDYSPLDLAPPGQRRRRQIVAAAVGLLTLLLLGAVGVFGYLLLRDEPSGENNLAASQTEVARDGATVAAQQTLVADSAAQETAAAGGAPASPDASPPPDTEVAESGGEATQEAAERRVATGSGSGSDDEGLPPEQLQELLPDESVIPEGLTESVDNERTLDQVVGALGESPEIQENLEGWGWSGNVERTFSAPDPAALEADATTVVLVSIHGFAGEDAAGEALTFYADALAEIGHQDGEAPEVGDGATRLLSVQGEAGETTVSLYVQQEGVVYRIVGISPGGDPTAVVTDVAEQLIEGNA